MKRHGCSPLQDTAVPGGVTGLWAFFRGIGAAGLAGDRISLGFLAETEKQVSEHLDGHLQRLPAEDHESRAILEQMRDEEIQHGEGAMEKGGAELPAVAKNMMRLTAMIMTSVSYRL